MPVALAAFATLLHLVLMVAVQLTPVPGASYIAVALIALLAVACFLLRGVERLFLWAGVLLVLEAVGVLVTSVVLVGTYGPGPTVALPATGIALADVAASLAFLIGFARFTRSERWLRAAFLGLAVVAGVAGTWQVVLNATFLVDFLRLSILNLALAVYSTPLFYLPIALAAATVALLLGTWARFFADRTTSPSADATV